MSLTDQKSKYSRKDLRKGPQRDRFNVKYQYGLEHEPHTDYFYGFLCLIYDGINDIKEIKAEMRLFLFLQQNNSLTRIKMWKNIYRQLKERNFYR